MTKMLTITSASGSYLIQLKLDNPVYSETLLPIFNQLFLQGQSISLEKDNLVIFKKELHRSLEDHVRHYQPGKGRGRERTIFGKDYFLTLLNTEHNTIVLLSDIYDAADDCIQNNMALRFEYS